MRIFWRDERETEKRPEEKVMNYNKENESNRKNRKVRR